MARVIPVIDVRYGRVVRAVGGRRNEYAPPVGSRVSPSCDPVEMAEALLAATRTRELYFADLDAIVDGDSVDHAGFKLARLTGVTLWADLGFRGDDVTLLRHTQPSLRAVLGGETIRSPDLIKWVVENWPATAYSIDLRNGRLMGDFHAWDLDPVSPQAVAEQIAGFGVRTLFVIDVASVGERLGPFTGSMLRSIRAAVPGVDLIAGGGVRDWDDVRRLEEVGVDGVLVASALHDGTLTFPRPTL